MKLYIGNIPFTCTDPQLQAYFEQIGPVKSASMVIDRDTQRPKGYGFVEMEADADGQAAITELGGREFMGRVLNVQQAREREAAPRSGGFSRDQRRY
jgi:RNA recognition motif-containing protein